MEYVAYNFFETPERESIIVIADALFHSCFTVSHASNNDPPKKFSGSKKDLVEIIISGNDLTNYTFLKSSTTKLEATIEIHNDPRWEHSTISVSGLSRESVEKFCLHLNQFVNSFLCISRELSAGSEQDWSFLFQGEECPALLLEQVNSA